MENIKKFRILTVTLNPAIDRTLFIPGFKAGEVNRVVKDSSNAGGKGVNVASLLADYGFSLTVTGFLGKENALIFEELFRKKSIEDKFIRIDGATRTGIKIVDEKNKETTDINFCGARPLFANIKELTCLIKSIAGSFDWIVLAGSVPQGVPSDIYDKIIKEIKHEQIKIALDTSGQPLKEALISCPDLIKPNKDELEELIGRKLLSLDDIKKVARSYNDNGIKTVIVSMGADGALFSESGKSVLAVSEKVNLVSTVGAGDAMVSGTIAGKLQGMQLEECARLGTAFSISALSRIEADLPVREELIALTKTIVVKNI